jgi:hypothetical protein
LKNRKDRVDGGSLRGRFEWLIDAEFAHALGATRTDPTQPPAGPIDILTTVMHEMGHQLGLDDTYAAADVARLICMGSPAMTAYSGGWG